MGWNQQVLQMEVMQFSQELPTNMSDSLKDLIHIAKKQIFIKYYREMVRNKRKMVGIKNT